MTTLGRAEGIGQNLIEVVSGVCIPDPAGKAYLAISGTATTGYASIYTDGAHDSAINNKLLNWTPSFSNMVLISKSPKRIVGQNISGERLGIWNVDDNTSAIVDRSAEAHPGGGSCFAYNDRLYWLEEESDESWWLCSCNNAGGDITQHTAEIDGGPINLDVDTDPGNGFPSGYYLFSLIGGSPGAIVPVADLGGPVTGAEGVGYVKISASAAPSYVSSVNLYPSPGETDYLPLEGIGLPGPGGGSVYYYDNNVVEPWVGYLGSGIFGPGIKVLDSSYDMRTDHGVLYSQLSSSVERDVFVVQFNDGTFLRFQAQTYSPAGGCSTTFETVAADPGSGSVPQLFPLD